MSGISVNSHPNAVKYEKLDCNTEYLCFNNGGYSGVTVFLNYLPENIKEYLRNIPEPVANAAIIEEDKEDEDDNELLF